MNVEYRYMQSARPNHADLNIFGIKENRRLLVVVPVLEVQPEAHP